MGSLARQAPGQQPAVDACAALVGASPTHHSLPIPAEDWDALFNTVKDRLTWSATPEALQMPGPALRVRTGVLECVEALDQLHHLLGIERKGRQELEHSLQEARAMLAQVRAELICAQGGEEQARHLALHDSLTSLPNHRNFHARLRDAISQAPRRSAQTMAVLYLDLDGFKLINDTHGHAIGDELLRIVAARLTRALRAQDVVSRLGGDEFACLIHGVPGSRQLGRLAGKLVGAVSASARIGTLRVRVRASIGIASWPIDGVTAEALLESADAAMYRAKQRQCGFAFLQREVASTSVLETGSRGGGAEAGMPMSKNRRPEGGFVGAEHSGEGSPRA
ncbi:GGDEF domain-containing protein [Methylibium sp. Root1272]|uniref:GGDEF domain-containing protein n=1 Tax=Methylibium sp. Root1272 TaxID=1736441 RepID=UPI0012E95551|nr:GGDEF domain-containing protein [Methylibium sp. Root1272]